jgi:hypothetical protein
MNYFYLKTLLLLLLLPCVLFAQQSETVVDTVIYEKHGKPRVLKPKWQVTSVPDTFYYRETILDINNDDTLKNQVIQGMFLHSVDEVSKTDIVHSIYINSDLYQHRINLKDCKIVEKNDNWVRFQYRESLENYKSEPNNCDEIKAFFSPIYKAQIECLQSSREPGILQDTSILRRNAALYNDCNYILTFAARALPPFSEPFGMLVPKKGRLGMKMTLDKNISLYTLTDLEHLPNGNHRYTLREDTSKDTPAMVRMEEYIMQLGKLVGGKYSDQILEDDWENTYEVDKNNYPVHFTYRHYSRQANSKEDKKHLIFREMVRKE